MKYIEFYRLLCEIKGSLYMASTEDAALFESYDDRIDEMLNKLEKILEGNIK